MNDKILPEDAVATVNKLRLEAGEMPLMCDCGQVARTIRLGQYLCGDCFGKQAEDWWKSRPPQWWAERGLPVPEEYWKSHPAEWLEAQGLLVRGDEEEEE